MGLKDAESINFKYTTMSLNTVYDVGLKHAMKNIIRHGGTIKGDTVEIKRQSPLVVKFEKSFEPTLFIEIFHRQVFVDEQPKDQQPGNRS